MVKKAWSKPDVLKIVTGSAENGSNIGNDGCCGSANNKAS